MHLCLTLYRRNDRPMTPLDHHPANRVEINRAESESNLCLAMGNFSLFLSPHFVCIDASSSLPSLPSFFAPLISQRHHVSSPRLSLFLHSPLPFLLFFFFSNQT